MSYIESKELKQAQKLIDEAKLDEAFTLLNNYEQKESLNFHNKASCYLLKCKILFWQGKLKELIKHSEKLYKESKEQESNLFMIESLLIMAHTFVKLDKFDKAFDLITQVEKLINIIPPELTKAYKQKEAYLAFIKGYFYNKKRDPNNADLALKQLENSLAIREELGILHEISESLDQIAWNLLIFEGEMERTLKYSERSVSLARKSRIKYYIASSLHIMALIYASLGELDRCLKIFEQSLELFRELNNKYGMADILNNLCLDYKNKGDLDRSLECIEQAMALNSELGALRNLANNHDFLIQILIERGDLERAQQSLKNYKRLKSQLKDKSIDLVYLLDKAIVLKTSLRARDRGKAEEILVNLLEDENLTHDGKYTVLINLCELLLTELRMTNDLSVLDELNNFLGELLELAKNSNSYWILCETYLLQAKLALISLDLKEARRLLTQGQQIAEKYGIKLLAIKISNEHDELLKRLDMWKKLKESKASLTERMELARLNEQMESMIRMRTNDIPKISKEEPVLLLIVSEGGVPLFSQLFIEDESFEDHLFGGFFTAINCFINEKFSEGLDRASFGEHTLLMNTVSPFLMCYVYKGQSYSAQQRLKYFIEKMQNEEQVWQTFISYYQLNKEVQLKDIPSLEPLINETFIEKAIH
ncbi:MAG: tetratricopeptide repeat protein [Candidatus Thorarchaeota archaeon]